MTGQSLAILLARALDFARNCWSMCAHFRGRFRQSPVDLRAFSAQLARHTSATSSHLRGAACAFAPTRERMFFHLRFIAARSSSTLRRMRADLRRLLMYHARISRRCPRKRMQLHRRSWAIRRRWSPSLVAGWRQLEPAATAFGALHRTRRARDARAATKSPHAPRLARPIACATARISAAILRAAHAHAREGFFSLLRRTRTRSPH